MRTTRQGFFNRLRRSPALAETKTLFHIDAAQTFGKEVETLRTLRCDLLSISGHKIMGPKGVGGLYVKRTRGKRVILSPIIHGGGKPPEAGDSTRSTNRQAGVAAISSARTSTGRKTPSASDVSSRNTWPRSIIW